LPLGAFRWQTIHAPLRNSACGKNPQGRGIALPRLPRRKHENAQARYTGAMPLNEKDATRLRRWLCFCGAFFPLFFAFLGLMAERMDVSAPEQLRWAYAQIEIGMPESEVAALMKRSPGFKSASGIGYHFESGLIFVYYKDGRVVKKYMPPRAPTRDGTWDKICAWLARIRAAISQYL
jgi:hypothetical protein